MKTCGEWILECMGREKRECHVTERQALAGIAILIALFVLAVAMLILDVTRADAQELTASWYSVRSLEAEGTASYNPEHVMANGEVFEDGKMVAASHDFPLNTRVRITDKASGKSIVVTVADRTNRRFKGKRIDLSRSAMEALAGERGIEAGLVKVTVESI